MVTVAPETTEKATIMIHIAKEHYEGPTELIFSIKTDRSEEARKQRIKFLGPEASLFAEEAPESGNQEP